MVQSDQPYVSLSTDEKDDLTDQLLSTSTSTTPQTTKKSTSPRKLLYLALGLLVIFPLLGYKYTHPNLTLEESEEITLTNSKSNHKGSNSRQGNCSSAKALKVSAPKKNIWRNLDLKESKDIREWLYDDKRGLNLTFNTVAGPKDNTIGVLELMRLPKAEALAYIDSDGPEPVRYAHAFINHPVSSPWLDYPHIRDYLIGPLPVQEGVTEIRPLTEEDGYTNSIISWNGRMMHMSDFPATQKFIKDSIMPLNEVLYDLFGVKVDGQLNDTAMFGGQAPMSFDGEWRRYWVPMKLVATGLWLHPLDFQIYVDSTASDASDWKILKVWYNSQLFSSLEEFTASWKSGDLKKSKKPIVNDSDWAARTRKGTKRDLGDRTGPRFVSFDGPRFRYDEQEKYVTWMGWSFYLGFERDMGLNFWDIGFRGERIIYELTPQEALAQYSGMDPAQSTTVWLDRAFGMGALSRELMVGYDCPSEALYLPTTVHTSMGTTTQPNAICIFEKDSGRPLTRHSGLMKDEMGAIRDHQLTVRTVATIGNYDYIFEYSFQLDGTLEVRFSASGYLQGGFWDGNPERFAYGNPIRETTMGALHDHVISYKVDMDIAGTKNTLMRVTLENEVQENKWYDEDWGVVETQGKIVNHLVMSEDESKLEYGTNSGGMVVVTNQDAKNQWGVPRGYAVHPGASNIHLTNLAAKRTKHNVEWAKHSLHVTKTKDTEQSCSHSFNINLPGKPPIDFGTFMDGESLDQEDLVLWLNLGTHHIPRAEDSPHTLTNVATSYLLLTPYNFHDYDVSMESQNAVIINPGPDGSSFESVGDLEEPMCIPDRAPVFSYSGIVDIVSESGAEFKGPHFIEAEGIHGLRAL